ncbi:hypothetical protein CHU98_g7924 [Xylaria longipes]|nr:hypothetical protein CHU98_g7924 [Xylaria longipes]
MSPPCRVFSASQLPTEIQLDDGKRRKGGKIDLSACELLSMVQYDCQIDRPDLANSPVRCWPVQRWFRRSKGKVHCRDYLVGREDVTAGFDDKEPRDGGGLRE